MKTFIKVFFFLLTIDDVSTVSLTRGINMSLGLQHDDHPNEKSDNPISPRMEEFKKKLREKTPIGKLDEIEGKHPYQEKEPLQAWPNNTNPNTGEVGGPRGKHLGINNKIIKNFIN